MIKFLVKYDSEVINSQTIKCEIIGSSSYNEDTGASMIIIYHLNPFAININRSTPSGDILECRKAQISFLEDISVWRLELLVSSCNNRTGKQLLFWSKHEIRLDGGMDMFNWWLYPIGINRETGISEGI